VSFGACVDILGLFNNTYCRPMFKELLITGVTFNYSETGFFPRTSVRRVSIATASASVYARSAQLPFTSRKFILYYIVLDAQLKHHTCTPRTSSVTQLMQLSWYFTGVHIFFYLGMPLAPPLAVMYIYRPRGAITSMAFTSIKRYHTSANVPSSGKAMSFTSYAMIILTTTVYI